ncbi:MAG: hypothetical protein ACKVTZ_15470, partial [Bacteroidia bacterium]
LLKVAQFSNCFLLFDEAEKIITNQNTSEKKAFCENLRYYFADGNNENANINFFKLLLTIHPQIQQILGEHWATAGLERFADIGGEKATYFTIFFSPIKKEFAVPLAKAYLNAARLQKVNDESIAPFEIEALDYAFVESYNIPGKYLELLSKAVEEAVKYNRTTISQKDIEAIWKPSIAKNQTIQEDEEKMQETETNLNEI